MNQNLSSPELIVNADDFGFSLGISRGILYAHDHGIVTSTSFMVNERYSKACAQLLKSYPKLSVGLHFTLPTSFNPSSTSAQAFTKLLTCQYHKFLVYQGKKPSHLDIHQQTPTNPAFILAFIAFARRYKLATRYDQRVHLLNQFYGMKRNRPTPSRISLFSLTNILLKLKRQHTYLLVCHPGYTNHNFHDIYNSPRKIELVTLTNPQIMSLIRSRHIKLINSWEA